MEAELVAYGKEHSDVFESYVIRCAFIVGKTGVGSVLVPLLAPSVRVDHLAQAMIKIALNGYDKDTVENAEITKIAVAEK